jgi:hypothetical protein
MSKKIKINNTASKRKFNDDFLNEIINLLENNRITEDQDEKESLLDDLIERINIYKDISSIINDKPIAFSKIQYKHLYEIKDKMGWNIPKDLHDLNPFNISPVIIPKNMINDCLKEINEKIYYIGIISDLDNEAKKKCFIDIFVDKCISFFKGEIINDVEGYINNALYNGRIEYILKSFTNNIIVIIEAKKDIEYQQNYGQIMTELYAIYETNKNKNNFIDKVYGVLTTSETWIWWCYDGKTFSVSPEPTILRRNNPKSIPIVLSTLFNIIYIGWKSVIEKYIKQQIKNNDLKNKLLEELKESEILLNNKNIKAFNIIENIINIINSNNNTFKDIILWEVDYNYL